MVFVIYISMRTTILTLFAISASLGIHAQTRQTLTLQEAVQRAQAHSAEARSAAHAYRAAYWNYRSYKANMLPSVSLTSNPELNRSITAVTLPDGTVNYAHRNQLMVDAGVEITQNVPWTGGQFFVNTNLQRLDVFTDSKTTYRSVPVVVGYQQNLFGHNSLKWNKRIEPIRFTEAKKNLVETMELVAARATQRFFQLAAAG